MEKVIIIRYAEIHLKGKNRGFFEKLLVENIELALSKFKAKLKHISGRYIVYNFQDKDEKSILNVLEKISGIFSFSPAIEFNSTYENIAQYAKELSKNLTGTFKVETNRADKTFPLNSMLVSKQIGEECLKNNPKLKVDVIKPDNIINIDIRENGSSYIFTKTQLGMGGMPVGSSGNGLLLLSGGIDSPVAGYLMAKRGVKLSALHFHSFPYTSPQAKEKVIELAKKLTDYSGNINLHIISVTKIQQEIHKKCKADYMITLLRRFMFRIAEKIAKDNNYKMIITGENLGQVASQTIESMTVVENVIENTVIARPLIAFDKVEIIDLSKKINTYDISIQPYEDCCTVFLPRNPVTRPKLENVLREEAKLDVELLIEEAMNTAEIITI